MDEKEKVNLLYQEYMRLNERVEKLIDSSLTDFKILAFISPLIIGFGALFSKLQIWNLDVRATALVTFTVFIILLFIVVVIGFRDFLKQSMINYHLFSIASYERELRHHIDEKKKIFKNINWWLKHFSKNHITLQVIFTTVIVLPIIIIPFLILKGLGEPGFTYSITYLVSSSTLSMLHFASSQIFLRKSFKKLTFHTFKPQTDMSMR